ncbi:hypothetical protein [Actinomadura parmotrematis]|uniref:Plasmid replication, integration and excision activator n=1 Tax=Actinomadura parmotrematis TaxID=2864039 RepID=A0ABS7G2E8_9ACTN|nr:hypothetical protein [Actinomadura parmotrematis]MBW8486706.1 hypothetical protein [Actinomadura parmotrematis]
MQFQIVTDGVTWLVAETPEARRDFESGDPKVDKETGAPLFQVRLLAMGPDGSAPLRVSVVGDPGLTQATFVRPVGLVLNAMERRGESITWWTVERLEPLGGPEGQPGPAGGSTVKGAAK